MIFSVSKILSNRPNQLRDVKQNFIIKLFSCSSCVRVANRESTGSKQGGLQPAGSQLAQLEKILRLYWTKNLEGFLGMFALRVTFIGTNWATHWELVFSFFKIDQWSVFITVSVFIPFTNKHNSIFTCILLLKMYYLSKYDLKFVLMSTIMYSYSNTLIVLSFHQ